MRKNAIDKIPRAAMPMVHLLRADIKRPRTLPKNINKDGGLLRWYKFRLFSPSKYPCPMGLHPLARADAPGTICNFRQLDDFLSFPKRIEESSIVAFANWWDGQRNPRAMYKIWPRKLSDKERDKIREKLVGHRVK